MVSKFKSTSGSFKCIICDHVLKLRMHEARVGCSPKCDICRPVHTWSAARRVHRSRRLRCRPVCRSKINWSWIRWPKKTMMKLFEPNLWASTTFTTVTGKTWIFLSPCLLWSVSSLPLFSGRRNSTIGDVMVEMLVQWVSLQILSCLWFHSWARSQSCSNTTLSRSGRITRTLSLSTSRWSSVKLKMGWSMRILSPITIRLSNLCAGWSNSTHSGSRFFLCWLVLYHSKSVESSCTKEWWQSILSTGLIMEASTMHSPSFTRRLT